MPLKFLDRSSLEIRDRYDDVASVLAPYRADVFGPELTIEKFSLLLDRLRELQVDLCPVRLPGSAGIARIGGTVVIHGRRPILWVDLGRHANLSEIVNTVFHEAIHATALYLERWMGLPDADREPDQYLAEELVALRGSHYLSQLTRIPTDQILIDAEEADSTETALRERGYTEDDLLSLRQDAESAANFLASPRHLASFRDLHGEFMQAAGLRG